MYFSQLSIMIALYAEIKSSPSPTLSLIWENDIQKHLYIPDFDAAIKALEEYGNRAGDGLGILQAIQDIYKHAEAHHEQVQIRFDDPIAIAQNLYLILAKNKIKQIENENNIDDHYPIKVINFNTSNYDLKPKIAKILQDELNGASETTIDFPEY